jgi:hypothetical protein
MSVKYSNNTLGNQTHDLPACSAVPQRTAPPLATDRNEYQEYFLGCKDSRCVGLTTLLPSCADCLEIFVLPFKLFSKNKNAFITEICKCKIREILGQARCDFLTEFLIKLYLFVNVLPCRFINNEALDQALSLWKCSALSIHK